MTISSESKPEQTEVDTQDLPTIPTVQEMRTWDPEKVLRWIRQRGPNILIKEDHLNNFKKERIMGRAFLVFSVEHFQACGLPRGVGLALMDLVDEVKAGEFIPRM